MLSSLPSALLEHVGTTLLHWLRDPDATADLIEWTPRNIRDQILHMIPLDDVEEVGRLRMANALARWIQDDDGFIRVRYQRDSTALNVILRVMKAAIETEGAEESEDIINDETAWSYPRLYDFITYIGADMRALAKEQKRLGVRPKEAFRVLLQRAHGSILDTMVA